MGYAASAIGNHEFDFWSGRAARACSRGRVPLPEREHRRRRTMAPADFATPYVVVPVEGVAVGVIGLTTISSSTSAHPGFVSGLEFTDYVAALEQHIPHARADGAEVVVVLGHVCLGNLLTALTQTDLVVDVALGGHCHAESVMQFGSTVAVESGAYMGVFSRIDLTFDTDARVVVSGEVEQTQVRYVGANPVTPDAQIAGLVDSWQQQVDTELSEPVGHTAAGLQNGSWAMANWVTDSWLAVHSTRTSPC